MSTSLFNRFGNTNQYGGFQNNILSQLALVKKNPGAILDILLQSGKINQQQYSDLQKYKNDPQAIVNYLIQNGNAGQINQAQRTAGQFGTQ